MRNSTTPSTRPTPTPSIERCIQCGTHTAVPRHYRCPHCWEKHVQHVACLCEHCGGTLFHIARPDVDLSIRFLLCATCGRYSENYLAERT